MNDNKKLSDTELTVMQIIWDKNEPVSRSVIEKELCLDRQLAPSTILTFLTRLCDKGFLSVSHKGRSNLYSPLISRQEYQNSENKSFINRLYKGSMSAFATALCDSDISRDDLEELKRLLEENLL